MTRSCIHRAQHWAMWNRLAAMLSEARVGSLRNTVLASVCLVTCLGLATDNASGQNTQEAAPRKSSGEQKAPEIHALLVGVTKYPSLGRRYQLEGPANDVNLLSETLISRFGIPEQQIERLIEGKDETSQPTRLNIQQAFLSLANRVRCGDQVLIFMAGHGSQMPNEDETDSEADGFDEIFLPRDVVRWNGKSGRVDNCISDDELHQWTSLVREAGAFVFFVGDFCHSGTSTRNAGPIARGVPKTELEVPGTERSHRGTRTEHQAAATSSTRNGGNRAVSDATPDAEKTKPELGSESVVPDVGEMVALYASQPHELTYEDKLPRGGQLHGWLSWALCSVLNEAHEPLTYRELATRISWHYGLQRWHQSTPLMAGKAIDREVFGNRDWSTETPILLTRARNTTGSPGLQINAGALRGITQGSILSVTALHSPAGAVSEKTATDSQSPSTGQLPQAYVKVVSVGGLTAECVASDRDGHLTDTDISCPALCQVVYSEFASAKLQLRLDVSRVSPVAKQTERRQTMNTLMQRLRHERNLPIEVVELPTGADIVLEAGADGNSVGVRRDGNASLRTDAAGVARPSFQELSFDTPKFEDRLASRIMQIYRAETLRRLATPPGTRTSEVRLGAALSLQRQNGANELAINLDGPVLLKDGDQVVLRLKNQGYSPVDLTVLHIAADSTISSVYPDREWDDYNRCRPGETTEVDGLQITNATLGWEDLIVIGVKAQRQPIPFDFGFLADQQLASASESVRKAGGSRLWDLPFVKACRASLFQESGLQRGLTAGQKQDVVVHRVSWNVVK